MVAAFAVGVLLLANSFASSLREEIVNMSDEQAVSFLAGEIWRASLSSSNAKRGEEAAIAIVAIDGHAEILAKRFEENRSTRDYQSARVKFFKILSRIESAGSIKVLSSYLVDDVDVPSEGQMVKGAKRNSDTSPVAPNSVLAAEALDAMKLPDAPLDKLPGSYTSSDVEVWKSWWRNKVAVHEDGELNPPEQGESPRVSRPQVGSMEENLEPSQNFRTGSDGVWKVVLGGLVVLALFFAIFVGRKRNRERF